MALDDSISYVLDGNDCIEQVGDTWDRFARAHGAAKLRRASVVGTSMWVYIRDPTVAELYRLILARVRRGKRVVVPYDGTTLAVRREMRLELRPLTDGHIRCVSSVVMEDESMPQFESAPDPGAESDRLLVCSWCGRVRVEDSWCDVEEAVSILRPFHQPRSPAISHGLCPRCAQGLGVSRVKGR